MIFGALSLRPKSCGLPDLRTLRQVAICLAACLPVCAAAPSLPTPPATAAPSGVAFPEGFDVFPPPAVSIDPIPSSVPAIAEFTRSGAPGDTLAVSGWQLSRFSGGEAGRDTRFVVVASSSGSLVQHEADIVHQNGDMAAVRLPTTLPAWSTYFLYPINADGAGPAVLINKTELWWTGPVKPAPGEPFHVFGRNLSRADGESVAWIYFKPTGTTPGSGRWLQASAAGPLHSVYTLPADLPVGSYDVWAHNTHGGVYGWSGPLPLEVRARKTFAGATFNATAFGATPDDDIDDTDAIQAAINAAFAHGNATAYLPAGRYLIRRTLWTNWGGVRIAGAGMDATTIAGAPNFDDYVLVDGSQGGFEMRDLTLAVGNAPMKGDVTLQMRGAANARFHRVRIVPGDSMNAIDNHGGDNNWFEECEFITPKGHFLGISRNNFFVRCSYVGRHDVNSFNYVWGGRNLAFLDCTAANFDGSAPDGHSKGRFLSGAGVWESTRNLYVGGLRTTDQAPRLAPGVDNNSGEQIMFESLDTYAREPIASATATTLALPPFSVVGRTVRLWTSPDNPQIRTAVGWDPVSRVLTVDQPWDVVPGEWTWLSVGDLSLEIQSATATTALVKAPQHAGRIAVVVAGRGLGQSREISAFDFAARTFTLAEPWLVVPDATSVVVIGNYMTRTGVYGCQLDGKLENVTTPQHSASTGVQPYGGAQDVVVQRNTFRELRGGISEWAFTDGDSPIQPNYFNLFTENQMIDCRHGLVFINWEGSSRPIDPGFVGNVSRRNRIVRPLVAAVEFELNIPAANIDNFFNVFDGNEAEQTPAGFYFTSNSIRDTVLIGNRFTASGSTYDNVAVDFEDPRSAILRDNQFTGFGRTYGWNPPGALPALPRRVFTLDAATPSITVPVWNNGTDALNWTVTSAPSWLSASPLSGTVATQTGEGAFTLAATDGLAPGDYTGPVILTSSTGLSRALTVQLNVPTPPLSPYAQWRASHGIPPETPSTADLDGDGIPLLLEYAFAGDPHAADAPALLPVAALDTPTGRLRISFLRARADLTYTVQASNDLASWADVAVNPGTVGTTVTYLDTAPVAPRRFLRVSVTAP